MILSRFSVPGIGSSLSKVSKKKAYNRPTIAGLGNNAPNRWKIAAKARLPAKMPGA